MTFAIETATKAKLEDVRVLSQKNRQPDENPGVQLSPEAAWPFPKNKPNESPPQSATTEVTIERSQPGTRTARGRDKTKAALAAGKH